MKDSDKRTDRFNFSFLPTEVATYFRDALGCYRAGMLPGFTALCRLTADATFRDLGEGSKLRIFDQVEEIAGLAGLDDNAYRQIRDIIFDTDNITLFQPNGLDRETAAVLLETMKEILHQTYIRRGLLRQKLRMRRYFANPVDTHDQDRDIDHLNDPKVSPLKRPTGTR